MGYKKRTNKITDDIIEVSEEIVPETVPQSVPENTEDADAITPEIDEVARRKQEIADKRRASLALARSKIVPKSALKKQAAEVIKSKDELLRNKQEETDAMKLKYERDRIKTLEDNLMALQKLIADKPTPTPPVAVPVPVPVPEPLPLPKQRKQRPSRSKEALEVGQFLRNQALALREQSVGIPEKQPKLITPKKSVEPRMIAAPSTERLIDKSYGEQLQERLRSQALHKIMNETFGGF